MAIHLKQFGLNWSIDPDSELALPSDFKSANKVNTVVASDVRAEFSGVNPNVYTIGGYLGGGSYGSVYECKRVRDGLDCVIKVAQDVEPYDLIKEALIQIIIVETTKNKKHPEIDFYGPYAPIIYDIGYNYDTGTGYIVSQKMRATVATLISSRAGRRDELIHVTSLIFIQISTMISELYKSLGFNHRDFKSDNCMYIRDAENRIQLRLIDFGLSYLKYNKVAINGSGFGFKHNSLPRRDMTQLMYEIYMYNKYLPIEVLEPLEDLLTFPLDTKVCKMYKGCALMEKWSNTYDFLNDTTVSNPNGDADVVKAVFLKVVGGLPYKSDLAYAPGMMGLFVAKPAVPVKVPKQKIYNPDTGRYVFVTGQVGKRLMAQIVVAAPEDKNAVAAGLGVKLCKEPKPDYNPNTKRCVKGCAEGKKRNATFKCVKGSKKIVAKVCPAEKPDYNPNTKRCVKACPAGKKRNATFKCTTAV